MSRPAQFLLRRAPVVALLLLSGCAGGRQSSLDPAGPQAQQIDHLWWLIVWICLVVYVLVLAFLLPPIVRGLSRARNPHTAAPDIQPDLEGERRTSMVVVACAALTIMTLFVLLFADVVTGRSVRSAGDKPTQLSVRVVGHQWWWEIQYTDWSEQYGPRVQSNIVSDANEIHLPAGQMVKFELSSSDVIHSFWIPNLHGKKDLVPGHPIVTYFQADRSGTYGGQCAEFCGLQHANMRMVVVVEPPEQFHQWLEAARKPAAPPSTPSQQRGQQVFMTGTCVMCHTITGTTAGGRVGPPLTHIASRLSLAAGTLPNTRGHRGGWVLDPQRIKPGVRMPQNALSPPQLSDLMDYLDSLK